MAKAKQRFRLLTLDHLRVGAIILILEMLSK